ncbi:Alcohol dehydrogenase transcription factor Myb/SANT-like [Nesidiocoris tenuis]|uniref:Alcohol dehydrogenase transcription factor Myb/SANT-like n=1 Tax=Nesidiocoris tenuis TaxID=355587 RepID=A0ABN7APH6_9HEMI|nr:Alcohol dehydrogenase transcription factor Myb/SANT-like [Nesidiocoris tenuis]
MDMDRLICEVFQRKALWDQGDPKHHNRFVLDFQWDEVAAEMNTTRDVVRKKWKSLRDNFRKELQKESYPPFGNGGSEPTWKSSWRYFESLRFLQDQFTAKSSAESFLELKTESVVPFELEMTDNVENSQDFTPQDSSRAPMSDHSSVTFGTRKRQLPVDEIEQSMLRLERRLDFLETNQKQSQKGDDDEAFFTSLLPYVRPLAPADKLLLRIKMQQLIYDFVKSASPSHQPSPLKSQPD